MDSKKMNQQQLANALGSKHPTISRWLKGDPEPSRGSCLRIASVTGCSFEWLWKGEGKMFPDSQVRAAQENPNPATFDYSDKTGAFNLKDLFTMTLEVNESDSVYRSALSGSVKAFHHAVVMEKEMVGVKEELANLKVRIEQLEQLLQKLVVTNLPEK